MISCSDDRFARVLDYRTYRLRNKKATYGTREARKMGRVARNMKHSFTGQPNFSGQEGLKVFSWLRKLVKACNDNDVSEGMALYVIPQFLSGDAELRYARALPDSTSASGGASITSFPEAVNWFLETYAEPHTLALAQDRFSRATKGPEETVEAFAVRLRGLTEACGNIHSEGTMKQQLIQGLPDYLRTDAFVFNGPDRTYQQLVTFSAGKFKAATDVIKMAQSASHAHQGDTSASNRRLADYKAKRPLGGPQLMAVGPTDPPTPAKKSPEVEPEKLVVAKPALAPTPTPRPAGARSADSRRPFRCYLCWEVGHMGHQCRILTEGQRATVLQARDNFLHATRGRSQSTEVGPRADHNFHRRTRMAMVQALCEGINDSDDELGPEETPTAENPPKVAPSGKE